MIPRPPRLAEALLSLMLPGGGIRESVLGDLHELYVERLRTVGRGAAVRWYWHHAVRLAWGYGGRRLAGARFRGFAPAPAPSAVKGDGRGERMESMVRQVRYSLRALRRSPAFTVPALFILAIGMTGATAIFTVADAVLFRPLDFPDSHELIMVCEDHARLGGACIASPATLDDFRRGSSTVAELGFARGWHFTLTDAEGTRGVRGGLASAGFLRAVGVEPGLGRLFGDDEFGADNDNVAILSYAFWMSRYGGDPSVVGSSVTLEGESCVVVGVLPAGFELPFDLEGIQLWRPPHIDLLDPEVRGWRGWRAIGRLAEGASVASASAELTALYRGLDEQYEEIDQEWRLRVDALLAVVVGSTRPILMAFLGAAALLLIIVCANVGNLLLTRGLGRRQEIAVRAALGAERGRLVREILTEGVVLSAAAALVAILVSGSAVRGLLALAPPGIPRLDEVAVDTRVLAFTVVMAGLVTLLFAALPAVRVTAGDLAASLKSGARSGENRRSFRIQSGLVVAELALSVVLLSSAALLSRSFLAYVRWDPGFDRDRLMAVSVFADMGRYPTRAQFMSAFREGEETLATLPGVVSAATASAGPLFGGGDGATAFATDDADLAGQLPTARWFDIGPGYFATLGLPVVEGREFSEDDAEGTPHVAVVNQAFAARAWPGESALGRRVRLPERGGDVLEVVGVVADVPSMVPGEAPYPEIYWPNRQLGRPAPFFLVRTSGDPTAMLQSVKDALLEVDADFSLGTPFTLSSRADRALVQPRFQAVILLIFALAALVLSAVGVYAVVSYAVARRTREVGIRVALGASRGDVVTMMARTNVSVAAVGIVLGLGGAAFTGRLIQGLIPGVSPWDGVSLGGGAAALLLTAVLAILVPARRASRVDPVEAIRVE